MQTQEDSCDRRHIDDFTPTLRHSAIDYQAPTFSKNHPKRVVLGLLLILPLEEWLLGQSSLTLVAYAALHAGHPQNWNIDGIRG